MNYVRIAKTICSKEPILYAFVALIATFVDFGILYSLTEWAGFHYLMSLVCAFAVAALTNFILQKVITFRCKRSNYLQQYVQFLVIAIVGLGINIIIVWAFVEIVGLWYIFAKAVATVVAFFWNYSVNRRVTFGNV